jgi:hypothetical protein
MPLTKPGKLWDYEAGTHKHPLTEMLRIERVGGLVGFGGANSRLRSRGQLDATTLSIADVKTVEALFLAGNKATGARVVNDGFIYRITRSTAHGDETVEAPESLVPRALINCVKDELI